tara:strand:+ start:665 stop:1183 length:519 start_codon:yes stop_codon:yes gene_type:complete
MKKRGAIWISAVLYMGLGIMILSMVLAVGLPAVQKMKDRYTIKETKNLMLVFDENIRTVYQEGPGSQRVIDLKIGRGTFEVDETSDLISWSLQTKVPASQPEVPVTEGNLEILTTSTPVQDQYGVTITLDYDNFLDIIFEGDQNIISGNTKLSMLNKGEGVSQEIEIHLARI